MPTQPFQINVQQSILDDLQERLARTRWIYDVTNADWDAGTDPGYLRELCAYWQNGFNWRQQEERLNSFHHFRSEIDNVGIHFIHERGKGDRPIPLLLTHGWPDSFLRFSKIIPMLTDPEAHGGDAADSFDVVVPSLPGYGFSDKPKNTGMTFHIAGLWHKLMTQELGYEHFAAHGGDWGGMITEQLGRSYPGSMIAIHLTDVPFYHMFQKPDDVTSDEQAYLKKMEQFQKKEGAYAMIQGTRPQTLAPALNDSPAGLAAWIAEKFRGWSDCGGNVETRFTKDELLTNIMIYWTTGTIHSSLLPYYDLMNAGAARWIGEKLKEWMGVAKGSSQVPAGFAIFPKDLVTPPREWAERFFNVQRWSLMPRGGHFAAMEEPELLAQDIRQFLRPLRAVNRKVA
jgi:pimeloyl-ACP methyl ester carboxylesterase